MYGYERLNPGGALDLISMVADHGYAFYSVESDDRSHVVAFTNGDFNAYRLAHDLNTLALVIEEAKKPYSTGESIRRILGVEASPINLQYASESVYVEDEDNYERGEN